MPATLDAAADSLTSTPGWWKTLLYSSTAVGDTYLHQSSAIPPHLQRGLRKACNIKASPEIKQEIQQSTDRPITYEEFSDAIDTLRAGSAPGPSGATPSMLKAWNPAIRRFIFDHMQNVWSTRTCPPWFRDKLIKLAPKVVGSNELNHMQPISLYEIIRKVWTTTVAKRIHIIWHHRHLLNPAQYGYRLNNGILMPLYNIEIISLLL